MSYSKSGDVRLDQYGADSDRELYGNHPAPSPWNPKTWSKKIWAAVIVVFLILVVVIPVAVTQTRRSNNAYPNYSELSYQLSDTYQGEDFFDQFDYFTGYDPTGGFVHYVPSGQAQQLNLTYASSETAVLRVDTSVTNTSEPNASTGRFSVRVTSKTTYDSGLFLFDVKHTPFGCGTWPALWLSDPNNWPDNGEMDVMEAVNQAGDGNQMTLHTTDGCTMKGVRRKQTGHGLNANCDHEDDGNAGCGVKGSDDSFGEDFNENGGGVMALEWRDAGIRMWQFARSSIPADIANKTPDPSTWGTAAADFPSTDCNVGNHFRNQSIILNINLCGELVYHSWDNSGCPSNCTDLVANYPDRFTDAYWEINSFQVYQAS